MEYDKIRMISLFAFKLGDSAAEAYRKIIQAFGEGSVNQRNVQVFYRKFRNGEDHLNVEQRPVSRVEVDHQYLKKLIREEVCKSMVKQRGMVKQRDMRKSVVSKHLKKIRKKNLDKLKESQKKANSAKKKIKEEKRGEDAGLEQKDGQVIIQQIEEDESANIAPTPTNQNAAPPISYCVMKGSSQRGNDQLFDSYGYHYSVKSGGGPDKRWICSLRNKHVLCYASVKQIGNLFERGPKEHLHPPNFGTARARKNWEWAGLA